MHPILRRTAATVAIAALAAGGVAVAQTGASAEPRPATTITLKDARLKFEVNATDRDGGVQLFIDADGWRSMSLLDPSGRRLLTTTVDGAMARQGGTELFMESAEPDFATLPLPRLLRRFPEGRYRLRGTGLNGERMVGTAIVTHDIPAGPRLLGPLPADGPQRPDDTTVRWEPVPPPNGSPIIGYQVLVVRPATGVRSLPKVILDVMMPPGATSMRVPAGFLVPGAEYEWEVLALEAGGNQTLSSSTFTTAP